MHFSLCGVQYYDGDISYMVAVPSYMNKTLLSLKFSNRKTNILM